MKEVSEWRQAPNLRECIAKIQGGGLNPNDSAQCEFRARTLSGGQLWIDLDGSAFSHERFLIGLLQQVWERAEAHGAETVRQSLRETLGIDAPT